MAASPLFGTWRRPSGGSLAISDVAGLQAALDGAGNAGVLTINDVAGLQSALDAAAGSGGGGGGVAITPGDGVGKSVLTPNPAGGWTFNNIRGG